MINVGDVDEGAKEFEIMESIKNQGVADKIN